MITVHIVRDKEGMIREFSVEGHAGHGKYGSDIVCAAVSVLAQTAIAALEELAGIKEYSISSGDLKCKLPPQMEKESENKAGIILETMAIGLKHVESSYRKYVKVLDKEV